jgi:chemotaxis protein MotB
MELDDNDPEYLQLREQLKNTQDNNWLISYSDIITILLAFFMIFYAIEKNIDKNPQIAEQAMLKLQEKFFVLEKTKERRKGGKEALGKKKGDGLGEVKRVSPRELEYKTKELEAAFGHSVFTSFKKINKKKDATIFNHNYYINIVFNRGEFFKKGSYILNWDGRKQIDEVVKRIKPFMQELKINIIGHTDKTPVHTKNKSWWKSNMELSVLRSLDVYKYLLKKGLPREQLFVSGMGDLDSSMLNEGNEKVTIDGRVVNEKTLSKFRRITLRIEPK